MMSLAVAINNVKDNFIPAMINIFTFSRCYHTELILSDGTAIYCGPKGVKYIKRDNYDMYSWILIPLNEIDAEAEDHIKKEVNRYIEQNAKYDWIGAIFGRFSSNFNDESKWFCSELCAKLLSPYYPELGIKNVWWSPEKLWKMFGTHTLIKFVDDPESDHE